MIAPLQFDRDGVRVMLSGHVSSGEIMAANQALIDHPLFTSWRYQLWIYEAMTELELNARDVKAIADMDRVASRKNPGMMVLIVCNGPLAYGFSRMYETFCSEDFWKTIIFNSVDSAEKWLASNIPGQNHPVLPNSDILV